eukprot:TRINITY_DN4909_c0_g1_i1.p1 TRINITY_DN4909_c0_g1~~TRINITY_DN4909_c0_g1_i1.p1  ORF type:complete len:242 (-),score=66.64 TRINITY_DN4909_c0_g1_i1:307-963(-)
MIGALLFTCFAFNVANGQVTPALDSIIQAGKSSVSTETSLAKESLTEAKAEAVKAEAVVRSAAEQAKAEETKVEEAQREASSAATTAVAEEKRAEGAEEKLAAARENVAKVEEALQDSETKIASTEEKTGSEHGASLVSPVPGHVSIFVATPLVVVFAIIAFSCRAQMQKSVYAMALSKGDNVPTYIGGDDFFDRSTASSLQPFDVESQIKAMCGTKR